MKPTSETQSRNHFTPAYPVKCRRYFTQATFLLTFLAALALFGVGSGRAEAAEHAIRAPDDCAYNGDGTTWGCAASSGAAGAFDGLPTSLTRGDIYYLGGGTYPGYNIDDAVVGSTYIYLKRATDSAHGTLLTDWVNTIDDDVVTFACDLAVGSANTGLWFQRNYISVDGVTGGGPSSWQSGHGIVIELADAASRGIIVGNPLNGVGYTGARISHVEIKGPASCFPRPIVGFGGGITAAFGGGAYGNDDMQISYVYIHNIGGAHVSLTAHWQQNVVIEYSAFDKNASGATGSHGVIIRGNCTNDITVRYNSFANAVGTATIGFYGGAVGTPCEVGHESTDNAVYGNLFYCEASYGYCGSIPISFQTTSSLPNASGAKIYNNTFYSLDGMGTYGEDDNNACDLQQLVNIQYPGLDNVVKNNLIYNVLDDETSARSFIGVDLDYNAGDYAGSGITPTDAHWQQLSSNPFVSVDPTSADFGKLSANTDIGTDLGSPYNVDILGNARTTWSRGAYEYVESGDTTPPSSPSGLTIR